MLLLSSFMAAVPQTPNQQNMLVPALVLVLVALAFGIGVLWQKVETLEKGGATNVAGVAANPQAGAPAPAPVDPLTPVSEDSLNIPKVEGSDHVRGNKNAKVTIVEYSDLECPFCKQFHPTMLQAMKEYEGKVKWVYRHYPLSQIHPSAQKAAEASECAYKTGGDTKFWEYVDKVFEVTAVQKMDSALLVSAGEQIGLNKTSFESCINSGEQAKKVTDQQSGGTSAGVSGTPAGFILDGKGNVYKIEGALPFETLKQMVEKALNS